MKELLIDEATSTFFVAYFAAWLGSSLAESGFTGLWPLLYVATGTTAFVLIPYFRKEGPWSLS